MPVVTCPKCKTPLKIPDGATGNVKCPKCTTLFAVAAKPAPAFEVVDTAPKPAPARAAAPAPARPPVKAEEPDFEVVDDEPRAKKKSSYDDDDDDDRPRKRRRDDDDDDDDRPRSKRRRDDDDDRPRKKSRRRRYDDDDDYDDDWRPGGGKSAAMGKARVGVLLFQIAFWLHFSAFALLALFIFIGWVSSGSSGSDWMITIPGILGLSNWIVAAIGCGFCIAGPQKARGMAITAAALSGAHLILAGITFNNMGGGGGLGFGRGLGAASPGWLFMATTLPFLDGFLPMLFYASKLINGDFIFGLLAAGCEVARLVFLLLTIRALAVAARDHDSAERAGMGVMTASVIVGGAAIFILLVAVIMVEAKAGSMNLAFGVLFLVALAYTAMMLVPALVAGSTQQSLAYRARR